MSYQHVFPSPLLVEYGLTIWEQPCNVLFNNRLMNKSELSSPVGLTMMSTNFRGITT